MDTPLVIGVIEGDVPTALGLARAAARHPDLAVRALALDPPFSDSESLAGVIVDVPLGQRAELLARAAARWSVPMLIEAPAASDLARDDIVVANPLRYALHTRRLLEELAQASDPPETFFAAWRFRAPTTADHALPQLLDLLQAFSPDPDQLGRVSAMQRSDPSVLTVTLRYASDLLGSIEVGSHLPESFPSESELVVECFGHTTAYSCVPGAQAVQFYGRSHGAVDWQPDPADAMVAAFAAWLNGGPRPPGGIADDLKIRRLVDRIRQALQMGGVLDVQVVEAVR
jgi:hypothetical protein